MSLVRHTFHITTNDTFECWAVVGSDTNLCLKFKDLARRLGYINEANAYSLVDDDLKVKWGDLRKTLIGANEETLRITLSWHDETLFVTEPGMYMLFARTHKRPARAFMRFVYTTILPMIRKTGVYVGPNLNFQEIHELQKKLKEKEMLLYRAWDVNRQQEAKIATLLSSNNNLLHRLMCYKPNLAIMSLHTHKNPEVRVYRSRYTRNRYRIVRAQHRNMSRSLRRINTEEYELVFSCENVPNAVNAYNLVKDSIPKSEYTAYHSVIITEHDLVGLFEKCLFNVPYTKKVIPQN